LKSQGLYRILTANKKVTKCEVLFTVIPASEARRESFLKPRKDSGQAGMTDKEIPRVNFIYATLRIISLSSIKSHASAAYYSGCDKISLYFIKKSRRV